MSFGNLVSPEVVRFTQVLILGAIGGYFVFRGLKNTNAKGSGGSNDNTEEKKAKQHLTLPGADNTTILQQQEGKEEENAKKPVENDTDTTVTQNSIEQKYGKSPEVFYDEIEQCYVVVDPNNEENLIPITIEELKQINGGVLPEGVSEEVLTEQEEVEEQVGENEDDEEAEENREDAHRDYQGVIGIDDFEDFQEDAIDFELEQRNAQLADQQAIEFQQQEIAAVGNGAGPGPSYRQNRTVGAKKAKSLKKKDQKRAYHEYMRDVSAARRAEEEKFEQQYGDLIALEREERAKRNEEVEREQKLRLQKQKEEEKKLMEMKDEMRQRLHDLNPGEYLPISDPEEIKIAHGLKDAFVVNNESFVVRLSANNIQDLAEKIAQNGSMSFEEMANVLAAITK